MKAMEKLRDMREDMREAMKERRTRNLRQAGKRMECRKKEEERQKKRRCRRL